jgi:PIN domain nuclease of toxin-antitoxin system
VTGYLLDSHTLLWWLANAPQLGARARTAIAEGNRPIHVSAAVVWEIAIKSALGKLPMIADFQGQYPQLMTSNGFNRLDITDAHALRATYLEGAHRDPFDRLIAAQALVEDLVVVTRDPEIAGFGCKVLW